ncbi:SMP-30/gluconolactonase/LRE family protein [Streptomyces sp. NBC_01352]|uniref:SMP-30/gluconolactonase/LRE family protein n=1 Tax=unclassified Streptomyces TaxID=2593676 RepID=UPI002E377F9C|nr:SMP-30/gluconolactonase/LRE family protein [Streptomyces sp. NBC_01352]
MRTILWKRSSARVLKGVPVTFLAAGLLVAGSHTATTAVAATPTAHHVAVQDKVITLPGATSAEGIAAGKGTTFYAGDLYAGDIYRGDIRTGTAERFIDAPAGRAAVGMKVDTRHGLLFVAGDKSGQAYVYSTSTGAEVATLQLATPGTTSLINDVVLTAGGAWFTDSAQAKLHFVPVSKQGTLGQVRTLDVTGPAAELSGEYNLNGIEATPDGKTLIVGHFANQRIYTINPDTGASTVIKGVKAPNADGLVLHGRDLWVVQGFDNKISRFKLSGDLRSGTLGKEITSPAYGVPATAARFGHLLAAVNAHFDTRPTPQDPPASPTYEVVVTKS